MADKKPKKTYGLTPLAKKELRKQELGIKEKPIAEKVGEGLGDNTALLNQGLQNVSFSNRPVNTTTFEPPATQQNVTQQPEQQTETTGQQQNYLLNYGNSGLPNSEVSTLLGSVLTGQTQQNLYDNVSHSLNKIKEGAELFDPNVGLTPGNAFAGIKFMNGLAGLSFLPITAVNEVLKQNPVTDWLNKGAMLPFELADELYTLTQKGTDYAFEKITGNKPDRNNPLSQELDEFVRTANQLLIGGKTFHETGKFFKKGMPEVKEVKQMSYEEYKKYYDKEPELININLPEFKQFRENNPTLLLPEKAGADFYATPDGQIITLTDYEKPAKNVTNGMTQEEIKLSQKNISGKKLTAEEQSKINSQILNNADLTETNATEKKPYEQPATIIGEQPKQTPEIDLGNKRQTFTKIINEFDKDLQNIEQKLSSGEITKQEFDALEKQYNETESRKKSWEKRLEDLKEEPKPIETVEENKRPSDDIYSQENIKNPKYPDRTNEVIDPDPVYKTLNKLYEVDDLPTITTEKNIKLSDIKNGVGQQIEDAINNVKNGLESKTEGKPLVVESEGKYYIQDGFHRIAKAIINNEDNIVVDIAYKKPKDIAEAYHKAKLTNDNPELIKKTEDILKADTEPYFKTEEGKRLLEQPKTKDAIPEPKQDVAVEKVEGESKLKKVGDKITYKGEEGEIIKVYPQDELDKKQGYQSYRVRIESGERDVDAKMLEQKTPISKNIKINTPLLNLKNTREKSYYEGVSYHNGEPVVEVAYIFNDRGKLKQDTKYIPYDKFEEKYTPLKNENEFKKVNRALRDAEKIENVKLGGLTEAEKLKREQDKSILIEKTIGRKLTKPESKLTPEQTEEPPTLTQKKQARKKQIAEKKEAKVPEQQGETLLEQVERAIKNPKDFETDVIKKEDLGNRTYSGLEPNYPKIQQLGGIDAVNKTKELVKISKEYSTKYKKYGVENKGTIPDEINRIIFKDKNGTYKIPIERLEEFKKKIQKLDEYSKAKQTIKSALSKDSGISFGGLSKLSDLSDPKVLKAVYDVAKYHLENGAVKLADFSRRMVKEVGDWVKPHLRSLWDELNKNRTGIGNIVTSGINTIKKIKDLPKEFKGVVNTNEFKEWYKDSKVRDENGNPIQLYSGHSNAGLYGEYNPKKSTAGGFYATENPEVASGYALSKFGSREGYENGLQYRIKGKNGKYNKKLYQYELSENQKKIIDELKNEQNEYGDYDFHLKDMERYIAENSKYDADVRRWGNTGGIYNLRNIYEFNEQMGYNIAYDKQGEEPRFMRQQENDTELIMNRLGIDWNSYDWEKPGIFPVYLNIKNPIDADKPFPADLLKALEDKAKYERYKTEGELHYYGWTNDYPLREWVKDIKDDNEGWSTKIPKNALPIIKSFGYDGIKERGMKATGLSREERSINWIAFDKEQILNKFDYNYLKALKSLKEKINRPNMTFGLDALPEVYTIAKYHTGKFAEWSKKVIKDVGNWIKPHLRNLYNEITKDRTGLDNVVTQGSPLSFKKKTEIIKDNVENPQTEVRDISEILPTAKNKRAILASDIFTKGDKEAGKDVFNYNNFTESAQINDLIREVATENKKAVDEQKRDIRTWAKTQEGADVLRAMGMDENAFLKLGKGDSLLAERIMAGKDIVNIAGKELLDRIKNLPEGNDPKITLANDYLKYVALVKNLKGLVSESGRALNIARKKSNADVQVKLDLADELIKAGFDTTSLPDFASKALDIIEPTYKDKFYYWWYNSMLSNPLTDVANITGNLSHFGFELMRNAISQNPKDSMQMLRDMKQAHIEGMKQVKDIIKNGETADSKFDYTERRYGEAFQPTSKAGKRFKAILPTTRLAFEDAYFRNMFGAIRKNATLKEISKETGDPVGVVENLIKAIAHNPDLASLDKKFEIYQKHLNALERFIDYGVFQTPLGEAGRNLQSGINKLPPAKMIFPFMKIAVNIAKTGIRTTPYGLKDFLTRKDLTRLEKKDIISRAVTGTAFLAGLGYLISQGAIEITGHGINDKDKRELWHKQGYKENHFYMNINGEKYGFSYQNINPINIPLSIIGNLQDDAKYNRKKKEYDDSNTTRIVKSLLGMAETLSDQSFMQGISNLMRYIQDKDIEGLKKNAQNLFTPNILSLPRDIKNMAGDGKTQYETNDPESRFKDKIGMTEGLKPKLNQFGEPIKSTYERFPFMVSKSKPDDKLTEFLANNNIEISFPSKQTKIGDQVLSDSPSAYYEYTKLSGQRFKEELLKQLPELEKLKTKEEKDDAVDKIVKDIRQQVKQEMSGEDPKEKKTKKKHLIIPGRPNPDKESERNSENKQTIKKHLIIPK